MSGILDNKSRIIDAILTADGRRQMAEGTFQVSYVTFTDSGVAYQADPINGHADVSSKIYFETNNLPQDQITFEANDEGKLISFRGSDIKDPQVDKVFSSNSFGTIVNGRLVYYTRHYGRRIKTSYIQESPSDANKGFIYSDTAGLTGSILISPTLPAPTVQFIPPVVGGPYVSYIGTKGGMDPIQFSQAISGAIETMRKSAGPNVVTLALTGSVYFDIGSNQDSTKTVLYPVGVLSSLQLEPAVVGGRLVFNEADSSYFSTQIGGLLTSSFDNFSKLQTISTVSNLFEDGNFSLSSNEITFDISGIKPTSLNRLKSLSPSLNSIDSLFSDKKVSHLDNFLYLPPIVKTPDSKVPDKTNVNNLKPYLLGNYPSWGDNERKMKFSDLQVELKDYESRVIRFEESSLENRVIGQFFEVSNGSVSKLDVVEFGEVRDGIQEPTEVTKKVFFVGKTFLDNRGTTCFINMFTLIFSKDSRIEIEDMF